MTLSEAQQRLIADYLLIEDAQERFNAIVDRARSVPALPDELRTEANRIRGCTSRVWLHGKVEDGLCRFQADAESAILRGVVVLLIGLYDGYPPAEVIATEAFFLRELQILDQLTLTRRNGLRHVRARMIEIAAGEASG